jgi:hypothetical protein
MPHLRLSYYVLIPTTRQLELTTSYKAAVAGEFLRLYEFENGSSREKTARATCCI